MRPLLHRVVYDVGEAMIFLWISLGCVAGIVAAFGLMFWAERSEAPKHYCKFCGGNHEEGKDALCNWRRFISE